MRQIQKELGVDKQRDEEIDEFTKKLESIKEFLNEDAYKEIKKQINRLAKMHQDSADANLLQNYVEWGWKFHLANTPKVSYVSKMSLNSLI